MYIFDLAQLKLGDIILIRFPNDEVSNLIRDISQSNYSHAMIYVGGGSIVEAGNIVEANNIQRILLASPDDACVLRLVDELWSEDTVELAVAYSRIHIGMQYSTSEARRILRHHAETVEPNRQICTRLVAQAYSHAGVEIVETPDYCATREIEESPKLRKVDDVIIEATEKDIEIANSPNLLTKQTEIIAALLERCRDILGKDVQSLHQLTEETYSQPDKVPAIVAVLRESGYLDLWREEMEMNPHLYNKDAFIEYYGDNAYVAALHVLETNETPWATYKATYFSFYYREKLYGSNEYVGTMLDLYLNLLDMCYQRYSVAMAVIS